MWDLLLGLGVAVESGWGVHVRELPVGWAGVVKRRHVVKREIARAGTEEFWVSWACGGEFIKGSAHVWCSLVYIPYRCELYQLEWLSNAR